MAGVDAELDALVRVANATAEARGHGLGQWTSPRGDEAIARSAVCDRCGEAAYVRREGGLAGMTGAALTEPCRARAAEARR
jgi:hypothetical protein